LIALAAPPPAIPYRRSIARIVFASIDVDQALTAAALQLLAQATVC